MSGFLLDTNVVSELVRPKPEPRVAAWFEASDEHLLFLSVLTLGEIRKGITALTDQARQARLEAWLTHRLMPRFQDRILSVDIEIADRWGRIAGSLAAKGTGLPVIDGLMAATALHYNLTLVTRNVSDVAATDVPVFDPWK